MLTMIQRRRHPEDKDDSLPSSICDSLRVHLPHVAHANDSHHGVSHDGGGSFAQLWLRR